MMDDVFCKIINGEMKADIVYKDDDVLVIKDIHPQAPIHLLIMPIKHVEGLDDAGADILGKIMLVAKKIAEKQGLGNGYRLILNEGSDGGKLVPHLHMHMLGGKALGPKLVSD